MKRINKKGFTLIELLAVIVILGVVMAIAIPSMNKVIDNSKKDTLVSTAQEYINGAKTMLLSANELPDYNNVLVVPIDKIELDRGGKSPYTSTEFDPASSYVVVVNKADENTAAGASDYQYHIALLDGSGNCLKPTSEADLNNKAKTTRGYIASGNECVISNVSNIKTNKKIDGVEINIPAEDVKFTIYGATTE